MEIVKASASVEYPQSLEQAQADLARVEAAGRTCYKSEGSTGEKFVGMLIRRGHLSVLEHAQASIRIICDRGVSHELVRHRIASFSQESTRYVNYQKRGVQFIDPREGFPAMTDDAYALWWAAMQKAEYSYQAMIEAGCPPELARAVLPNSIKTELVMTANLREWIHFLSLRNAKPAHPQMREIASQIQQKLAELYPCIFEMETK